MKAFGPLDIQDSHGDAVAPLLRQPKRSALLAYLAIAHPGALCRRDTLLSLFWPELDQERGRHALSQALLFVKKHVCEGATLKRGIEEVGVDPAHVRCDVVAFEEALEAEDWCGALRLYRGHLLEGFHVAGATPFVDWVDRVRHRLRLRAAQAAWTFAGSQVTEGDLVSSQLTAERALELAPTDEKPVRDYVAALSSAGDRGAALRFYDWFRCVLERELDVEPAPQTVALIEAVRNGDVCGQFVQRAPWAIRGHRPGKAKAS